MTDDPFYKVQLRGIGGPGAPHLVRLDRIGDTGSRLFSSIV